MRAAEPDDGDAGGEGTRGEGDDGVGEGHATDGPSPASLTRGTLSPEGRGDAGAVSGVPKWARFLTVASWGVYGAMLHTGQMNMGDPVNGRYKAFLFVGIAYFLTAVLAPIAVLVANGATWTFPAKGLWWSLIAGIVGAIGAFGVLLAFGAKGTPAVVMSIVFAGAPIVNAIYSLSLHPPAGGFGPARCRSRQGVPTCRS